MVESEKKKKQVDQHYNRKQVIHIFNVKKIIAVLQKNYLCDSYLYLHLRLSNVQFLRTETMQF